MTYTIVNGVETANVRAGPRLSTAPGRVVVVVGGVAERSGRVGWYDCVDFRYWG